MKYIFVVLIFLYSCTTQKKAIKYFNDNENIASNYCAEKYPVQTDTMVIVQTDTTLLKEYITEIDSIEITDTICLEYKEKIKYIIKNNPPITKTITIEKENTAKIKVLQLKIDEKDKLIYDLNADKKKYENRSNKLISILIFLLILILIYIYAKYFK